MNKSYDQKAAVYWSVLKHNNKISANEIGRRYSGTPYAMRKQDRNDLVKSLKDALEFKDLTENSKGILPGSEARMLKNLFKSARQSTKKGQILHPHKKGFKRRSIRQTIIDTFGTDGAPLDVTEYYGI